MMMSPTEFTLENQAIELEKTKKQKKENNTRPALCISYVPLASGQNTYVNLIFFCMGGFSLFFYYFSVIHSSMRTWIFILRVIDQFYFVA